VLVAELDLGHLEAAAPLGLVTQTILERTACVLLSDEELYRFGVVKLVSAYRRIAWGPYSAHLAGGHFRGLNVTAVDGSLEASVCCARAGHRRDGRWVDSRV